MAVAFRAAAAHNEAAPTTGFTVTIPASVQAGDSLYCDVMSDGHLSGTAYPSVVDDEVGGDPWTLEGESATNRRHTTWHRKATANTASKTITVTGCVGSSSGGVAAYSGAHSPNPTTNFTGAQLTAGTETLAGFTPDYADEMICLSIGQDNDTSAASQACTNPGALTERYDKGSLGGSDAAISHASALQVGGPTATGNFTWAQGDAVTRVTAWAIRPAGSAHQGITMPAAIQTVLALGTGLAGITLALSRTQVRGGMGAVRLGLSGRQRLS